MARSERVVRRMLTTEEAATYLGTTVRHIRRLVTDHELSRYKVGGRNRFADLDLDVWLDSRRIDGARRPVVRPAQRIRTPVGTGRMVRRSPRPGA